jgi:carbon-monoxide dehydrogenase large subunit
MQHAGDLPIFAFSTHNVPTTSNPLGVKGAGEAGAVDALNRRTGARHIDMPATPRRVWEALNAGH